MASSFSTTTTTILSPFSLPSSPHRSPKSLKYPIISPPTRRLRISSCLAVDPTDGNLSTPSLHPDDDDLRIVFAAGGTGGHIYPAIAIADDLKLLRPDAKILFLGTGSGMESISAPSAGFDFAAVPAVALARPLLSPLNLVFPVRFLKCVLTSYRKLRDIRPRVVVGTGGYVAAPVCLAAALSGVKVVIQEQNSVPGLANRLLGLFADKVFVSFESCSTYFPTEKCVVSGNPVRASLRRYTSKAVARMHFFPRAAVSGAQVLLVLGGSLGANSINIAVLNMYYQMLMEHTNRFIIWQTGVAGFDEMESLVRNHPRLLLTPFLHTMDLAYAGADLVVSRAGAMTCSEILATGKPSILIPSPNVAEGHQITNAYIMENIAGSRIILEEELDSTTLGSVIDGILGDENEMALISEKAMKAAGPDASAQIAQHILSLTKLPAQTTK